MNTITSYLDADHARCDALLRPVRDAVRSGRWHQASEGVTAFRHALERHLLIEETIVFPAFDNALRYGQSPTVTMRGEHQRIRGMIQRLDDALGARDADAFLCHFDTLGVLLYEHSEKEEGVLYPAMERLLARQSTEIIAAMRAFGTREFIASHANS